MVIAVQNVKKDYYQYKVFRRGKLLTKALQGVSFKVKEGDFFGLLGQNGAGKSTLMKILTTNLKKSSGKVNIAGHDLDGKIGLIKEQISWMFGVDYEGYGWSTIEKNLRLAAYYLGMDKHAAERRIKELLEYFDLYKKRKLDVWRMSAGMQAKYALAAAMLKKPKILFLDEPLLGLDVPAKDVLRNFLTELNKEGTTIVYTDHQLQEMEKVCKNLVIIEKGEKVYDGTLENLKQKYRDTHVLELTCQSDKINKMLLQLAKDLKYVTDYELLTSLNGVHEIKVYTSMDSKQALLPVGNYLKKKGVVLQKLNAGLLGLEDVYKKFIHKRPHHKPLATLEGFHKAKEQPLGSHRKYLKHKHHAVRSAACQLLQINKRKDVEQTLQRMSRMTKPMQIACLDAVGNMHSIELLQKVKKKLNRRDRTVKLHLAIAQGKIGDVHAVKHLLKGLLEEESCEVVLDALPKLNKHVLHLIGKDIKYFNREELHFLLYHVRKRKDKEALYDALQIKYKNFKDKRKKLKQQKMIIQGKVR